MLNCLVSHGVTNQKEEVRKDKINLVSGAVTKPFAEMAWLSSGGDPETINRLTSVLSVMNTPAERENLFKLLQMLYGLLGLKFPQEAEMMAASESELEYFLFSFVCDFGEIMSEYLNEQADETRSANKQ